MYYYIYIQNEERKIHRNKNQPLPYLRDDLPTKIIFRLIVYIIIIFISIYFRYTVYPNLDKILFRNHSDRVYLFKRIIIFSFFRARQIFFLKNWAWGRVIFYNFLRFLYIEVQIYLTALRQRF